MNKHFTDEELEQLKKEFNITDDYVVTILSAKEHRQLHARRKPHLTWT